MRCRPSVKGVRWTGERYSTSRSTTTNRLESSAPIRCSTSRENITCDVAVPTSIPTLVSLTMSSAHRPWVSSGCGSSNIMRMSPPPQRGRGHPLLGSVLVAPLARGARPLNARASGDQVFHAALDAALGELGLEDLVDLRVLVLVFGLDAALFFADVRRVAVGSLLRSPTIGGIAARLVHAEHQVRCRRLADIEVLVEPESRARAGQVEAVLAPIAADALFFAALGQHVALALDDIQVGAWPVAVALL